MRCRRCERENETGARFCAFCGMIMEGISSAEPMPAETEATAAQAALCEAAAEDKTVSQRVKSDKTIESPKQGSVQDTRRTDGWFLTAVLAAFFSLVLQMLYIIERPSDAYFGSHLLLAGLLLLYLGALFLAVRFGPAITLLPLALVSLYQLLMVNGIVAVLTGEISSSLTDVLRSAFVNPLIDFQQLIILLCCVLTSVALAGKKGCSTAAIIVTTAALTANLCPALIDLDVYFSGMLAGGVADVSWSGWMLNGAASLFYISVLLMLLSGKKRTAKGKDPETY